MKKEHSSRWRKLDNAAQAFPAATGKKDTRVFRFYCQLKEDIQADLLQKALEQTMEHYPVFSMVLRKGLFWFYLEQRDLALNLELGHYQGRLTSELMSEDGFLLTLASSEPSFGQGPDSSRRVSGSIL